MFLDDKPQGEVTEAPAKTLKLSEAIRIGARLTPQCRTGKYFDGSATCAFGAAALAMGGGAYFAGQLHQRSLDASKALYRAHGVTIAAANDRGRTREEIADWLEALGY